MLLRNLLRLLRGAAKDQKLELGHLQVSDVLKKRQLEDGHSRIQQEVQAFLLLVLLCVVDVAEL